MQSVNPPTKHHYIPAFYLKRWCNPLGEITEYQKPHNAIVNRRVAPAGTGYQKRLYELRGYEPERAQQVEEKFFKSVDTQASNCLDLLESYGDQAPWTDESRSAWTRFILSLLLRCPEDITVLRKWWNQEFHQTNDEDEAHHQAAREQGDPQTFSEYLAGQPLAKKDRHQFEVFASLVDNAFVGENINNMHWHVIETPKYAPTLLTSDRPVIRTNNLAIKQGHIALPISPSRLFIACNNTEYLKCLLSTNQTTLVKECNKQIVESAVRFVYGYDESQRRFVENRFGKSPQPRIMESILRQSRETKSRLEVAAKFEKQPSDQT